MQFSTQALERVVASMVEYFEGARVVVFIAPSTRKLRKPSRQFLDLSPRRPDLA